MEQNEDLDSDKIWRWIPCIYDVKRVTNDTETTWNLSPSISLVMPNEEVSKLFKKIEIDTDRAQNRTEDRIKSLIHLH
jgi:hypothetical protein